jgi:S1-C subfamily serine protease
VHGQTGDCVDRQTARPEEAQESKQMKHFLGPIKKIGFGFAALAVAGLVGSAHVAQAQVGSIVELVQDPSPLLGHAAGGASQGYLGVELTDLDQDKAQALKLKDMRGAVITLIDHDAPAGQIGLKINDVVIQLNGQSVEGAEPLRRMLKEIPAGRKVSLEISRDGNLQTVTVELGDRRKIEADAWQRVKEGGGSFTQAPSMGILGGGGGDVEVPNGLHSNPFFGSSLNVGALVEPLSTQLAQYMGVTSGVMVKQVAKKSEAAAAGMKAFDVILRVGIEPITNLAGWDRALRSNEGKQVQVTVLRDRKQQTLTLQVDSKRHGEVEWNQVSPDGNRPGASI